MCAKNTVVLNKRGAELIIYVHMYISECISSERTKQSIDAIKNVVDEVERRVNLDKRCTVDICHKGLDDARELLEA